MWSIRASMRAQRLASMFAMTAAIGIGLTLVPVSEANSVAPSGLSTASIEPFNSAAIQAAGQPDQPAASFRSHRPRRLVISDRPLTGALGMTPPFPVPGPDPAELEAFRLAVEAALVRQERARQRAVEKDPLPTVMPIRGAGYVSGFGARSELWAVAHSGLDFSVPTGTETVAVVSGTIRAIFLHPAYGNVVQLVRDDGVEFWYCHLSRALVEPGERVRQGQAIALTGATGNVTGPHLHFEVRVAGVPTDPGYFLYRTPGVAGTPPAWAYAYSQTPPPGKTILGYPPDKKDRDKKDRDNGAGDKGAGDKGAKDNRNPTPTASPSAPVTPQPTERPNPEPSASPSPSMSPSASPSAQPSPSPSGSGGH